VNAASQVWPGSSAAGNTWAPPQVPSQDSNATTIGGPTPAIIEPGPAPASPQPATQASVDPSLYKDSCCVRAAFSPNTANLTAFTVEAVKHGKVGNINSDEWSKARQAHEKMVQSSGVKSTKYKEEVQEHQATLKSQI
jgi:hypothetical protein